MHYFLSSSVTPSLAMSSGSTIRVLQILRCQQNCHLNHVHYGAASAYGYADQQPQAAECIGSSSANNLPVSPVVHLQRTARVEIPSDHVAENDALPIVSPPLDRASTSISGYQHMARSSHHVQANYPVSTSYVDEDGRLFIDQSDQLLHHPSPVPITQAHIPFQSYHHDAPFVNAVTPHYDGGAQDRASDNIIHPSIALSSPNASIVLPHAAGHPLEYPQDDENVSKFDEPPFTQHATTEPTTDPAFTTSFSRLSNVSWSVSPNSVVPPFQGPCPSDHLDGGNIPAPVEWTATPTWFARQPYLPPNQQIEIASASVVPHTPPYTLPTPSQSNSSAHVANSYPSTSIPPFPHSSLPSSSECGTYDGLSDIGNGNLPLPAGPPMVDYLAPGIMIDGFEGSQAPGHIRTRHRTEMERNPRAHEPISTRRANHSAKIQSRGRKKPSAVRPPLDWNVRTCCGWQNEDGSLCGAPVTYENCAEHFATAHKIKKMAAKVKVLCRWCALSAEKTVIRKNLLRHLREAHLHYPR